jgi:hypothetical protein
MNRTYVLKFKCVKIKTIFKLLIKFDQSYSQPKILAYYTKLKIKTWIKLQYKNYL